ncbi:MAG: HDIG domain-containing protein [Candidatus Promineifilaceae bacterium]
MRWRYRLWQMWLNFTVKEALPSPARQEIATVLSPAEMRLFDRFSPRDQQHSYLVYQTLLRTGHTAPPLLAAALLHDIGKTQTPLTPWDRMLPVLVERIAPRLAQRWGAGEPRGWRRPFVVRQQHPAWGAKMAQAAGSHPLTVALINHHQDKLSPHDHLLRALQWADEQS